MMLGPFGLFGLDRQPPTAPSTRTGLLGRDRDAKRDLFIAYNRPQGEIEHWLVRYNVNTHAEEGVAGLRCILDTNQVG